MLKILADYLSVDLSTINVMEISPQARKLESDELKPKDIEKCFNRRTTSQKSQVSASYYNRLWKMDLLRKP